MADPKPNEIMEALTELRAEVEKKNIDQEKVTKIEAFLNEQEEKNQKLVADQQAAHGRADELKERVDILEVELARKGGAGEGKNYKESEEYKALHNMTVHGENRIEAEMKALLRTDNDVSGGYLVPTEMDNMITKKITEVSNVRSIARVRTMSSKSLEVPVRDTILNANYEGEAESDVDSTSTYSNETLTAFRISVTVPITKDMLMDSAFDMESEIMADAAEAFAQKEGNKFVLGTGVKQPAGFVADARLQAAASTSSTAATVDADDYILLSGELKVGYNPVYTFNRRTLADLRTKKSTTGQFLFQPGLNGPVANTVNGFPYIILQDMADIASNSYSVAFGDFRRGYTIVDRTGMAIVRDEVTQKKKAIVEFTLHRWNYGQVTLPEAIKLLKTAP